MQQPNSDCRAHAGAAAEGVGDDLDRMRGLLGDLVPRPEVIRRGMKRRSFACVEGAAPGPLWYDGVRAPPAPPLEALPLRFVMHGNSQYPREANNGPLWAGAGLAGALSAGIRFNAGPLSGALAPTLVHSDNRAFAHPANETPGYSPFAYPWHGAIIDWPLRRGASSITAFDPGQSHLRLDAAGFAGGLSTENIWWGPALDNPLLFSNTAAGFPHVFIGTSRPQDIRIGMLEFELIWGHLRESEFFDSDPANDRRLIAAAIFDFEPRILPGVYIGAARTYMTTIPPRGFGFVDYLRAPYTGVRENPLDPVHGDNQIIAVFARFAPRGSGFEAYAEWGRDDHWQDLEDFLKEPDHSQVYTIGFQQVLARRSGWLRLRGELTHLQAALPLRTGRGVVTFYTNASVPQGHTHRGQLLGAAIGPGSDAQLIAGEWLAAYGRTGIYVQRIRYDDDAYYANFGRFYGQNGHDVELTFGARQLFLLRHLEIDSELTYSHRYNRHFTGLENADFASLFTDSNWGLRLGLVWNPRLAWGRRARTSGAPP